jgi:hypothetical protein
MRPEQQRPTLTAGNGLSANLSQAIAARACRKVTERELHDRYSDAVDLAKQPGLLYRLHAMLND